MTSQPPKTFGAIDPLTEPEMAIEALAELLLTLSVKVSIRNTLENDPLIQIALVHFNDKARAELIAQIKAHAEKALPEGLEHARKDAQLMATIQETATESYEYLKKLGWFDKPSG